LKSSGLFDTETFVVDTRVLGDEAAAFPTISPPRRPSGTTDF
jgi:hypothetical protein